LQAARNSNAYHCTVHVYRVMVDAAPEGRGMSSEFGWLTATELTSSVVLMAGTPQMCWTSATRRLLKSVAE
jgi:hypothetical protein